MCILLSGCLNSGGKSIPNLRETYLHTEKKPFGTFIAFHELGEMFKSNSLIKDNRSFTEAFQLMQDTAELYISVTQNLFTNGEDALNLIRFVENGNNVFIVSGQFDDSLLNKLECKLSDGMIPADYLLKPYINTGVKINTGKFADTGYYRYFYYPLNSHFSAFNKANTRVVGTNEKGEPNFLVIFKGKGKIFLHCEPRVFSNYFLLQKNNYQYLERAFGYVDGFPENVYWNTYYVRFRTKEEANRNRGMDENENFNSLDTILSYPPLAKAFWLAMIMFALFILFGIKRRQRIIEMIKPNENSTVAFTETIGRLYLQKRDNKNIADKMVTYFNEFIRNNYFLNTNLINEDFITTLGRKTGVPREKVDSLFRAFNQAQQNMVIDDFELLSLNDQIQDFFKRVK